MNIKEQNITFGILARDCVVNLRENIKRVEQLGECFKSYTVIIYENDSKDGTAEEVIAWGNRNKCVMAFSEITNTVTIPNKINECPDPSKSLHRIEKMANFRNRVLVEMEKHASPDLFCFLDIDVLSFSVDSVLKAIENAPDDWGGLFGNGQVFWHDKNQTYLSPFNYDSFAYVGIGEDFSTRGDWTMKEEYHPQTAYRMTRELQEKEYVPCESAFNGIGIYKYEAIKGLRYTAYQTKELKSIKASICEHIPFNSKVRERGYGLYMVRNLKIKYMVQEISQIIPAILNNYKNIYKEDTSLLQPGIMAIIDNWNIVGGGTDVERLRRKNKKHLVACRYLIVSNIVFLLIIILLFCLR